jgi:hypothetical protein
MARRVVGALMVVGLGFGSAMVQAPETAAGQASSRVQRVVGEVTSIDTSKRRLILKTDTGSQVVVMTDDKTSVVKAQPGARDLSATTPLTVAEVAVGDRLLARGTLAEDEKTLAARQLVVMSRSDIARKREEERAEWRRRGVSGVIKALDPSTGQVTVETRSLTGSQTIVVATLDHKATFKRYAPDSVRFSDAVPGSFAELQVGDQVRVLGDRTPEGSRVLAEQVVSGAFRIVSGAVKSASGREVTIVDNETGNPLTVVVGPDVMVRRLPAAMAARLAKQFRAGAGQPEGDEGRAGVRPPRATVEGPAAETSGRTEGATLQETLERLPPMPMEELKPGDQIAVSSPKSRTPGRLVAAVLLAGIEPLLEPRRGAGGVEAVGLAPGALDLGLGEQ